MGQMAGKGKGTIIDAAHEDALRRIREDQYASLLAAIARQKAYERRLVARCQALIKPLLDVAGFEARIVLYPQEPRRQKRTT